MTLHDLITKMVINNKYSIENYDAPGSSGDDGGLTPEQKKEAEKTAQLVMTIVIVAIIINLLFAIGLTIWIVLILNKNKDILQPWAYPVSITFLVLGWLFPGASLLFWIAALLIAYLAVKK